MEAVMSLRKAAPLDTDALGLWILMLQASEQTPERQAELVQVLSWTTQSPCSRVTIVSAG